MYRCKTQTLLAELLLSFFKIGHQLIFMFLADNCPFVRPLVPLFWISGDVSSGF